MYAFFAIFWLGKNFENATLYENEKISRFIAGVYICWFGLTRSLDYMRICLLLLFVDSVERKEETG